MSKPTIPTINIDLSAKCDECGKDGRTANGLCLGCTTKVIQGKPMKSSAGHVAAMNWNKIKGR